MKVERLSAIWIHIRDHLRHAGFQHINHHVRIQLTQWGVQSVVAILLVQSRGDRSLDWKNVSLNLNLNLNTSMLILIK